MWLLQIWKWKDLSWSVIWTVTSDALLKKCFVQKGKFGGKKASCHEKNTLNRENSGKMLPQVRKSRHSQWPMPGEFSWGSVQQGLRHTATRRTSVWKDPMHVSSSLLTPLSSSLKINECLIAVYTRVSYLFFFFQAQKLAFPQMKRFKPRSGHNLVHSFYYNEIYIAGLGGRREERVLGKWLPLLFCHLPGLWVKSFN